MFLILSVTVAPKVSLRAIFVAPRRALLLRRAIGVEVVELAAGEHAAAPLAVCFRRSPLYMPPNKARILLRRALALFWRQCTRRPCLERLTPWRTRRIVDEHTDVGLVETERLRRVCPMITPSTMPGNHLWPHNALTRSPMENAATGITGSTRETVRQFGHAVSAPRRVVAVPTAPAICAKHAAWKRWPHAASATTPPSNASRQIEHCSMLAPRARTGEPSTWQQ